MAKKRDEENEQNVDRAAPPRADEVLDEDNPAPARVRRAADEVPFTRQEEIGATAGRSHGDILEQTLPHEEALKSRLRKDRSDLDQ